MANKAGRYMVKNMNQPSEGNVTEEKESELEEFIEMAAIIMGVLGHKVFVPLANVSSSNDKNEPTLIQDFYIKRSGTDASAQITSDGVVVLAGSKLRMQLMPSCPKGTENQREEFKDRIDEGGVLKKEILFKTPSGASSFVLGAPSNGNEEWKTKDGETLKDINEKLSSDDQMITDAQVSSTEKNDEPESE